MPLSPGRRTGRLRFLSCPCPIEGAVTIRLRAGAGPMPVTEPAPEAAHSARIPGQKRVKRIKGTALRESMSVPHSTAIPRGLADFERKGSS
jgi:hypothetical protein